MCFYRKNIIRGINKKLLIVTIGIYSKFIPFKVRALAQLWLIFFLIFFSKFSRFDGHDFVILTILIYYYLLYIYYIFIIYIIIYLFSISLSIIEPAGKLRNFSILYQLLDVLGWVYMCDMCMCEHVRHVHRFT